MINTVKLSFTECHFYLCQKFQKQVKIPFYDGVDIVKGK